MGTATAPAIARDYFDRLADRYRDAYRAAAATVRFGKLVKQWSLALASAVILGGVVVSIPSDPIQPDSFNWLYLLWALFVGVVILAAGYMSGTFFATQGQFTSTLLDTAVNTSPYLQDSEKASIMTL